MHWGGAPLRTRCQSCQLVKLRNEESDRNNAEQLVAACVTSSEMHADTGNGRGVPGAALKYRIVYLDYAARRPQNSRVFVEQRSDCENKKSFNIMAMLMVVVMLVAIDEHVVADGDGSSGGAGRTT